MTAMALALTASLSWGVSEFLGGLRTRTAPVALVLLGSQAVGLAIVAVVLAATWRRPDHAGALLTWAPLAGILSVADLGLLYLALARGPATVVAPIAATGAIVPAVLGVAGGDPAGALQIAGLTAALGGAALTAWAPGPSAARRGTAAGAGLAAAAAVVAGGFLVAFDRAGAAGPVWGTGVMRLTATVVAGANALDVLRRDGFRRSAAGDRDRRRTLIVGLVAIGTADIAADLAYAGASRAGDLSLVAVVSSLYPVVVVALARLLLGERAAPPQLAGGALALGGAAALAGATA